MSPAVQMKLSLGLLVAAAVFATAAASQAGTSLDQALAADNTGNTAKVAPLVDDLTFLRRVSIDLIGRIPTLDEIETFQSWPANQRRQRVVETLLKHEGFGDRWTVFMADLLRIRANADGGAALLAFVHKAVQDGMPYDVLSRQLITATGKAGKIPEAGFVLGDGADPMALAAATAHVFMGVQIACAQCHDHPFDVWKREQFYGMAAYFGKTSRRERELTKAVYVVESELMAIKWPPEGLAPEAERKAMTPSFPFALEAEAPLPGHVTRLMAMRQAQQAERDRKAAAKNSSVDELLTAVDRVKAAKKTRPEELDVAGQAAKEARDLNVDQDPYKMSELRRQFADLVTNPRNRYFSRSFVNRVWANLIGRGIVEPCDDFNDKNPPSHAKTLDLLADEFVAGGFDLRSVVKQIVLSDAYQRAQLTGSDQQRRSSEAAFVAAPVRRMLAESLFDSVVVAGHLLDVKHARGENMKTIREIVQVPVDLDGTVKLDGTGKPDAPTLGKSGGAAMGGMAGQAKMGGAGAYDLESAIEVDFKQVLAKANEKEVEIELTEVTNEELEAQKMMMARAMRRKYVDQVVETTIDDNPKFTSAMRMPSPAPPAHFLRIFGQPARDTLGERRDHSPSMRQALMMLNGKVTHEASRVGKLEPVYPLLAGDKRDLTAAVALAYREILTRKPLPDEAQEAESILREAPTPLEGMADLRWVLFNSHEFRYIP